MYIDHIDPDYDGDFRDCGQWLLSYLWSNKIAYTDK